MLDLTTHGSRVLAQFGELIVLIRRGRRPLLSGVITRKPSSSLADEVWKPSPGAVQGGRGDGRRVFRGFCRRR
jgi:hypothetical protein